MNWFALVSKPQHEFAITAALREQHYEAFVPFYRSARRWSDRTKLIDVPLFPRYSFCRFRWDDRISILRTQGVQSILSFSGHPAPIADEEIEGIQKMVVSGVALEPHSYLDAGTRVRVVSGPLSGVEGIVVRRTGGSCLVLNISLLQRSISASVDEADVVPVSHSETRIADLREVGV